MATTTTTTMSALAPKKEKENTEEPLVLSCDQSRRVSGWAVFELNTHKLVAHGTKDNKSDLLANAEFLKELIAKWEPLRVVAEHPTNQSRGGITVYRSLCELVGVYELVCQLAQVSLEWTWPTHWRSVVGVKAKKRAEAKAEGRALAATLWPEEKFKEDDAEAALIGYSTMKERIEFERMTKEDKEVLAQRKRDTKAFFTNQAKENSRNLWSKAEGPEWYDTEQTRDEYREFWLEKTGVADPTKDGWKVRPDYWDWLNAHKEKVQKDIDRKTLGGLVIGFNTYPKWWF